MASSIVILTGAGISKESGIDTFRDAGGIWAQFRIEDVATPEAFQRNPARVQDFYNMRRRALLQADLRPNPAHEALARLDREWPGDFLLVTQNVDDLHERAGAKRLLHMHGEMLKARCTDCEHVMPIAVDLTPDSECISCGTLGTLRPHVVWFGEIPFGLRSIQKALADCDLFISIGTSGTVYPAAGFVSEARARGARTVELNLEPSDGHSVFDEAIHGRASVIVPAFVERLLAERR